MTEQLLPEPSELGHALIGGEGVRHGGYRGEPLPPNAMRAIEAKAIAGADGIDPVIASFVDRTRFSNLHVYPRPGVAYDWRWTRGTEMRIFTRPGIDCMFSMVRIFREADLMQGYPMLVDIENQVIAYIVGDSPITFWRLKSGGPTWKAIFES